MCGRENFANPLRPDRHAAEREEKAGEYRPTSPRSPSQNGYAERLIGSIRRECIDHIIVLGERHLRHVPLSYMKYYNEIRTHLSLDKDALVPRAIEVVAHILCRPVMGGLHHQYVRI
jgi:Integrase core domain